MISNKAINQQELVILKPHGTHSKWNTFQMGHIPNGTYSKLNTFQIEHIPNGTNSKWDRDTFQMEHISNEMEKIQMECIPNGTLLLRIFF